MRRVLLLTVVMICTLNVTAQIRRDPVGVNVNTQGPTTVFISYGNVQGKIAAEAVWCAGLVPAAPDIGMKCNPASTWGRLPARYDLTRTSGVNGLTDIMTITQNVARRAYESAARGAKSSFFYVRRFIDPAGGPDEYVFVICRLAGGGASVPLALTDVKLQFATEKQVLSTRVGEAPPALSADIVYNGTGRLAGRWEVVLPGDEPPTSEDLLTEGSLPIELRGQQRRYTQLERFNVFLPPGGRHRLEGPPPSKLPTSVEGLYLVLLRVEATNDKEGNTDLAALGSGGGVVTSGGVAGFSLPVLRYYVGSTNPSLEAGVREQIEQILPLPGFEVQRTAPLEFTFRSDLPDVVLSRLEVRDASQAIVLSAIVDRSSGRYVAPSWLAEKISGDALSWRVVGLNAESRVVQSSTWRILKYSKAKEQ
ncbi:MAG TPA: hypothetical protein VNM92_10270 [Thermoanaerobaculia bacterium]|nr:hypothetical protein [Thermoanaerobaculia bacterium]